MSPTQRTLAKLREDGWSAFVVEKWNSYAKIRQDLGGFGDIIAWAPGRPVLIVQATSGNNVADRLTKIHACENAALFVQAQATHLETWGWARRGPRGERKTWQVRRVRLSWLNGEMVEQEVA